MTLNEAIDRYVDIPAEDKSRFLTQLSYELTLYMRGCYDESDVDLRATKLQGANEIQHHLAAEARHHLLGDLERYPDDVLVRICVEIAAFQQIAGELQNALTRCLGRYKREDAQGVV